ncbi:DUF3419 family protein [Brevundimonas sp.]|uniref:DUF3419 family protein n=1 Tax=Brevundimonas sp. TaxID=1871086 RepID=UPI0025EA3C5F|nr:DUF3419 family protein [Brevundimonas sp.]
MSESRFFSRLAFTSANEDGRTELAALRLGPEDRVLCLTGSGARVFDLLLGDPGHVVALDVNPAQCRLMRLKIAAWRALDHGEMLDWLGVTDGPDRLALHARVEPRLSDEDRDGWRRSGVIGHGVWRAGLWEQTLRTLARGAGLARGALIRELFACATVEDQARFWAERWDRGIWPPALQLLAAKPLWRWVGEPGGELLPSAAECERILRERFVRASQTFLFSQSDFAWLMLRGRHSTEALPLHLEPQAFDTIRTRLDRIEVRQGGLDDLPADHGFTAFSLSDFGSYTGPELYAAIWRSVLGAAAPGARWCERVLLNPLPPPEAARVDTALSERLSREDRAIVYDIRAGTIG